MGCDVFANGKKLVMRGKWKNENGWERQAVTLLGEAFPLDVPRLTGPTYLVDAAELPDEFRYEGAAAYYASCLDLKLRPHLGDKWQGRGFGCVVCDADVERHRLLGTLLHEFAHHLCITATLGCLGEVFYLTSEPKEMNPSQKTATDVILDDFWQTRNIERPDPWHAHALDFIWACCHISHRAWELAHLTNADYLIHFAGPDYGLSDKLEYLRAAGHTPRQMVDQPLLEVVLTDPPKEFMRLFDSDCERWHKEHE